MFSVGDTVCLKSGGPLMTIGGPGVLDGEVECYWFDLNEDPPVPNTANFPLGALVMAEAPDAPVAPLERDPDRG